MREQLKAIHAVVHRGDHFECDVTIRFETGDERCSYIARRNDYAPVNQAIIDAIDAKLVAVRQPQ